jgi:bifunctional DNA-binding transcriptional regulator/antitoxin component of YhaV-PrlF toxin-antitoxin module
MSDESELSETTLRVGKRGEIFTTKELRRKANIKSGGKVKAKVMGDRVILEPVLSIEYLLKRPRLATLTPKQAERLSERIQREEGIYGRG